MKTKKGGGVARSRNRLSQAKGATGETIARYALNQVDGLHMIERIHTPWKPVKFHGGMGRNIATVIPQEKISGDFRAVANGGRSVLIEVKTRFDKLRWSDLAPHQRQALSKHAELGGLSLLVWVADSEVYILKWPVDGLVARKSLSANQASTLSLTEIAKE